MLPFSSNSSSCRHIFNSLQLNTQNIFLKITPTPAGSDHRKFVDTFGRPLYTDWKIHVSKVLNPFNNQVHSLKLACLQAFCWWSFFLIASSDQKAIINIRYWTGLSVWNGRWGKEIRNTSMHCMHVVNCQWFYDCIGLWYRLAIVFASSKVGLRWALSAVQIKDYFFEIDHWCTLIYTTHVLCISNHAWLISRYGRDTTILTLSPTEWTSESQSRTQQWCTKHPRWSKRKFTCAIVFNILWTACEVCQSLFGSVGCDPPQNKQIETRFSDWGLPSLVYQS